MSALSKGSGLEIDATALRERVGALGWYHTLELAPGLETPGFFDLRPVAAVLPWGDLDGKRCLDIGSFDGFWAFEMERRGASEVIAADVIDPAQWDWPAGSAALTRQTIAQLKGRGEGFTLAAQALGSRVERIERSIHDLRIEDLGQFDLIYIGSLLLHLSDPIGALRRVHPLCRGRLLLVDAIDPWLTLRHPGLPLTKLDGLGRPWWWLPNMAGLARMASAAGFETLEGPRRVGLPTGAGHPPVPRRPGQLASREGRRLLYTALRGDPHAWLLAEPVNET